MSKSAAAPAISIVASGRRARQPLDQNPLAGEPATGIRIGLTVAPLHFARPIGHTKMLRVGGGSVSQASAKEAVAQP
jgi:hypothetical protein